jgi:hypothetical protein
MTGDSADVRGDYVTCDCACAEKANEAYQHLRAVLANSHLFLNLLGGDTLTSEDGTVIYEGKAFFIDVEPTAYFAADAFVNGYELTAQTGDER